MTIIAIALACAAAPSAIALPAVAATQPQAADNQELADMFKADQDIRKELMGAMEPDGNGGFRIKSDVGKRMIEGDEKRMARTIELFEQGALNTANDYYHAAFIFQHGSEPGDYLRAHHAASVASKLGHERAPWIAAASLDRYLLSVDQKQIYGTQSGSRNGVPLEELADRSILTNRERGQMGVPPMDGDD